MRRTERGMTLAEAVMALAVIGVTIAFSMKLVSTSYRATRDNINKQFATQKAISMLEELRALVQTQDASNVSMLDAYDDGVVNVPILTTDKSVTDPGATLSGNTSIGTDKWLYERRVTVQRVAGASDLRIVNVKVFVNAEGGSRLLAEVASVLSTIGQNTPPTQVYDIYLVAIENIPGWWLYMQNIVPFVESAMGDLEARQPGLQFRRHWIRKLSYGRDPYYTPYVNRTTDSNQAIDNVYFYPGLMPTGSAVDNYYPPDFFTGRVNIDGGAENAYDVKDNPLPYSLADQYNNGMRYPEELSLFNARVSAKLESATEPTLRLLLDDMYMHPSRYKNAMVINLHGELFPFPPVRNYSDAAKDPDKYPYVRAVTHPAQIHYGNGDNLQLRVYSYHTATANPALAPDWLGKGAAAVPITVVVKGIALAPNANTVVAVTGGVDMDGDGTPDPYSDVFAPTAASASKMYWTWQVAGGDTIFKLYNSPLKSPCVQNDPKKPCNQGGLNTTRRLYGLEYIPAPVDDLTVAGNNPFQIDLSNATDVEKNTARWIIQIPSASLPTNQMITIETRIGDDLSTGAIYPPPGNAPTNLSGTYVWRGTDVWLYGDANNDPNMPITERFQLLGDPRHCPYADLKMPHLGSGRANANQLGMGYNRYFDDFDSAANNNIGSWPGWSYDAPAGSGNYYGVKNNAADNVDDNDGWDTGGGMLEIDIHRMFQILRQAVVRTHSVYTTMTGFSYYYIGIGNEIGYDDANGFSNSIPVSSKPFDGTNGTRFEQSITNAQINKIDGGVKYIRENSAGNYWWSLSWLGELAPDSAWKTWVANGNLPTGAGAGKFSRVLRGDINVNLPAGTVLTDAVRRTNGQGSTTFFWTGKASSTFHHRYQDGTDGNIDTDGKDIRSTYNFPLSDTISNNRPFDLNINDTSMNPDHFLQPVYGPPMTLQTQAKFYKHSTNIQGSSLVTARDGNDAAFVVVNGLSPTGTSGVSFIARWSFLSLVQSFMSGGLFKNGAGQPDSSRVRELPRVAITQPNDDTNTDNPPALTIAWSTQWLRWDGLPYTPAYAANFTEDTKVQYTVMYSRDNGKSWLNVLDDTPATPGLRPTVAKYLTTSSSTSWNTPATNFPKGNYVVRVEAYRDDIPLHYAFHQYRVFIKR